MSRSQILLIEDQLQFRILVEASLGDRFEITAAQTQKDAISRLEHKYDLIILDVGLPDGDGFEICLKARQSPVNESTPIIFLTSREEIDDMVTAYRLGADDFITKPFNPHVLREVVVSKIKRFNSTTDEIQYGDVTLAPLAHRVLIGGLEVKLTKTEFALISLFLANIDIVLSRDAILDKVWGSDRSVTDRTIDVHVTNLRKKVSSLGPNLETVHGLGYRLRSLEPRLKRA